MNNLKGGPYYTFYPGSELIFLSDARWISFFILSPMKTYLISICSFNQRDYASSPSFCYTLSYNEDYKKL